MIRHIAATQYLVSEWGVSITGSDADLFNQIEIDLDITHEAGNRWRVPAYWAGENEWRVRFSPPHAGTYHFRMVVSDSAISVEDQQGILVAIPYTGTNRLLKHGALQIASNMRTFEFQDGTPFFWLGDTWWFNLSKRLSFPEDFHFLTTDRKSKGFSVVQVVAGLYPDTEEFDLRSENEAGLAWETGYKRINPAYFDMADLRIQSLVRSEMLPCIFGSWGYHLPMLGADRMRQHWRNLIARWSAYPVVWCLAGELAMPYYLDAKFGSGDDSELAQAWVAIGEYVKATDPYQRLLTVHPSSNNPGRDQVTDDRFMDFEMLQPGHDGYDSLKTMLKTLALQRERTPKMPVLVDEINYEEQVHNSHAEMQRLAFWSSFLSGSAGFTYGASGLWAANTPDNPWGTSPHGTTWSDMSWEEARKLPGATQIGLARQLLERYEWQQFEPHPDWVHPSADPENYAYLFAAGIPGKVRIVYSLKPSYPWAKQRKYVVSLEQDVAYKAFFWDPRRGTEHAIGQVSAAADGTWMIPLEPTLQDWVLVLEGIAK